MCHHHTKMQGNAVAISQDDELNTWHYPKSNPITPKTKKGDKHHDKYRSWDPCCFIDNDTYYAIFGGQRAAIAKSKTLEGPWEYCGDFLAQAVPGVAIDEDISCANFEKFGKKHLLVCISHRMGCRYYIGEWKDEQFYPESHAQMSWADNGFFAPRCMVDDKGRLLMWAWLIDRRPPEEAKKSGWSGSMSLPRVLYPAKDNSLRIGVPEELETLRYNPRHQENLCLEADKEYRPDNIKGNSIEILVQCKLTGANRIGLKVCCAPGPGNEEYTSIYYDVPEKKLVIDTEKCRIDPWEGSEFIDNKPGKIESAPFSLEDNELLTLRVFVDKSIVEVFANERQAVTRRIYPSRKDSLGVTLLSSGAETKIISLQAWDMAACNQS